jgi:hypothetical protein
VAPSEVDEEPIEYPAVEMTFSEGDEFTTPG